jgi:hypothetical protein
MDVPADQSRPTTALPVHPSLREAARLSYRLRSTSDPEGRFATEVPSLLGFATRDALRQDLARRSGGRLRLDPGAAS